MSVSRALACGAIAVAVAMLLSGCHAPEGGTLLLTFTLTRTGDGNESLYAAPGPHCASARREEPDTVAIEADVLRELGDGRPLLIVEPTLEGPWTTTGASRYAVGVPANVSTGVEHEVQPVALVRWVASDDRPAHVDGAAVTLPYVWTVADDEGRWRVEARLEVGPATVTTFEAGPCA